MTTLHCRYDLGENHNENEDTKSGATTHGVAGMARPDEDMHFDDDTTRSISSRTGVETRASTP